MKPDQAILDRCTYCPQTKRSEALPGRPGEVHTYVAAVARMRLVPSIFRRCGVPVQGNRKHCTVHILGRNRLAVMPQQQSIQSFFSSSAGQKREAEIPIDQQQDKKRVQPYTASLLFTLLFCTEHNQLTVRITPTFQVKLKQTSTQSAPSRAVVAAEASAAPLGPARLGQPTHNTASLGNLSTDAKPGSPRYA